MINRIFGAALFPLGLMVVLVPRFILPVCEYQGYNPMNCSHTGITEMFIGLMVMTVSTGLLFSKGSEGLRWLSFAALIAGVSVISVPEAIGYCHSSRMPCNYATVPVLRLLGVLIIALSLAGFSVSFRREKI